LGFVILHLRCYSKGLVCNKKTI